MVDTRMYFRGHISVDPASLVKRKHEAPRGGFDKLLYVLSAGRVGRPVEEETFTAVSVLQQLEGALAAAGVNDLVRLAVDHKNLYYDRYGTRDDLHATLDAYFAREKELPLAANFTSLTLVTEYAAGGLRSLVEIEVHRRHAERADPIVIRVNGVVAELALGVGEGLGALRERITPVFATQEGYEAYVAQYTDAFTALLRSLETAVCTAMKVDSVQRSHARCVVRPRGKLASVADLPLSAGNEATEPLFYGYPQISKSAAYVWLWGELSEQHNLGMSRCTIVDDTGAPVVTLGEQPVHALFDGSRPFDLRGAEGITLHAGHAYAHELGVPPDADAQWSRVVDEVGPAGIGRE